MPFQGRRISWVVECLPKIHEALRRISSSGKQTENPRKGPGPYLEEGMLKSKKESGQALLSFLTQSFSYNFCLIAFPHSVFASLNLNIKIDIFLGSLNLHSEGLCATESCDQVTVLVFPFQPFFCYICASRDSYEERHHTILPQLKIQRQPES